MSKNVFLLITKYSVSKTPQHIPLYPDTSQMRRSVFRGMRFVEKVLDTGKK